MPRSRSAEFLLLLACCHWPLSEAALDAVRTRTHGVDWAQFLRLTERHRVEGIAWAALSAAGVEPASAAKAALAAAAHRIAMQNLRLAAESVQLRRRLERVGVPVLFVKGLTLGTLAYGDIARKAGWDVDLLVAPGDVERAAGVLAERGYARTIPAAHRDLTSWHRHAKESVWKSADGAIWVELHTGLADNPLLIADIGMASPRQEVAVSPGVSLPTLARDELFAYLCVHGASSAWFRLKWIADVAALIGAEPPGEIERLHRRAVELGAGRAVAQALLLAHELFGTAVPPALLGELRSDWITRALVALAGRKLTGRAGDRELDEVTLGTATIHLTQLGLARGWRFKIAELRQASLRLRRLVAG